MPKLKVEGRKKIKKLKQKQKQKRKFLLSCLPPEMCGGEESRRREDGGEKIIYR